MEGQIVSFHGRKIGNIKGADSKINSLKLPMKSKPSIKGHQPVLAESLQNQIIKAASKKNASCIAVMSLHYYFHILHTCIFK